MVLTQLEYVVEIVRCKSMNKAAEHLFISQPNISKSIKSLENELGIEIFDRTNHGVKLTEEGKRVYYYAKAILSEADSILSIGKDMEQTTKVLNVVTQNNLVGSDLMAIWYQQIKAEYIRLKLIETNLNQVMTQVQQMSAELGLISYCNLQAKQIRYALKQKGLEFVEVRKSKLYAAVGCKNPFYDKSQIRINELTQFPIIKGIDDEYTLVQPGYELEGVEFTDFRKVVTMNSTGATIRFLSQTDAFRIIGDWNRESYEGNNLKLIPIKQEGVYLVLGYIMRKSDNISKEAKAFIDLINRLKMV